MPVSRAVRRALVALVATLILLVAPAAAAAHAQLEATDPPSGAVLARQPAQVDFRFGEAVEASLGAVRVLDGSGAQVQAGSAFRPAGDAQQIAVRLKPGLRQGTYTATYRVISADGHPVSGGVVFSVGRPSSGAESVAGALAGSGSGPVTATVFGVARGLQYGAIAVAVGVLAFFVWLLVPALDGATVARRRVRRTVAIAAIVGALEDDARA